MEQNHDMDEIDLLELARLLWSHALQIAAAGIAAAVICLLVCTFVLTPRYQASVNLIVNSRQDGNASITSDNINSARNLIDTYAVIIKSNIVLNDVIEQLGLDMTYRQLLACVSVDGVGSTQIMSITVTNEADGDTRVYTVPYSAGILVSAGDHVDKGQELTAGALNPHEVLRIRGIDDDEFGRQGVRNYLVQEVQKVYRQQGVDINDKHIEVIVRQMMRKVRIEDAGDTKLLSGATVDITELRASNEEIARRREAGELGENGEPLREATYTQLLMGITKASLATESFLSAASFQETTKVLTEAAIKGKVDHLVGLKENVIIGKLIPAGSGLAVYRNFESKTDEEMESAPEEYVDLSVLVNRSNAL